MYNNAPCKIQTLLIDRFIYLKCMHKHANWYCSSRHRLLYNNLILVKWVGLIKSDVKSARHKSGSVSSVIHTADAVVGHIVL